jgi:hypothetical protein
MYTRAVSPEGQSLITVSIASYNTRELLRTCLSALLARQREGEVELQIIVADNGSSDGSVEMVRREFPTVELLETDDNLGYGKANNRAFQLCRGEFFCPLNSDAEVQPGALATLRDFLKTHPEVGAAGPKLVYPDGGPQASYGDDPTVAGIFREQTFLGAIVARVKAGPAEPEPETPVDKDQIVGACQFVRTEAFRQIGGYDPAFFMYHEDVDLNIRLRRAGWRVVFVPQAVVVHHLGASSERRWQSRARMVAALNWSRYHAFTNHEGPRVGETLKAFFILGAAIRLAIWTAAALVRPSAVERVRLFRVVLRRAVAMRPEVESRDSMSGIG